MMLVAYKEDGFDFQVANMLFPYYTKRKEVRGFGWLIGLCLGLAAGGEESCLWRRNTKRAENQIVLDASFLETFNVDLDRL